MPITDEQAKLIKKEILKQISSLPKEQQEKIKSYILSMNNKQLEEFLIKNQQMQQIEEDKAQENKKTINSKEEPKKQAKAECIFCSIADKKIPSFVLHEDKDFIAALEIKPFSIGHVIIIPKKHIKEEKSIPSKAFTIANKVGRHLVKKLKAETFQINTSAEMNHAIINVIPIYKNQQLDFKRKQTNEKELQQLAIKIGEVPKKQPKKASENKTKPKESLTEKKSENKMSASSIPRFNRRIP